MPERTPPMSLPRRSLLGSGLALTIASTVRAQVVFPSRPIRMIVPYAAGGGSDMLARALGERLSPSSVSPSWWRTVPARARRLVPTR